MGYRVFLGDYSAYLRYFELIMLIASGYGYFYA